MALHVPEVEQPEPGGYIQCNNFVPNMEFASNVNATTLLTRLKVHDVPAPGEVVELDVRCAYPYGQTLVADEYCIVHGRDWLGQPMTEMIGDPGAEEIIDPATPAVPPTGGDGLKAFYVVDSVVTDAEAVELTWGDDYGVPYAGASDADADGNITAADETDPATETTGDTRGTILFTVEPNGATDKEFDYTCLRPLYGLKQFFDPTLALLPPVPPPE
jgi:hypothetical protein